MKHSRKRGQLWISAVLYIAIGVIAITLVLTAGLPLINKMKDKNTVVQAKSVMNQIDIAINDVKKEGVGSKRFLSQVIIKGGELEVDADNDVIRWKLPTKAIMVEPCTPSDLSNEVTMRADCIEQELFQKEGSLYCYETTTILKDEYEARVDLDYNNKIILEANNPNPLIGAYSFSIENRGTQPGDNLQTIYITIT